MDDQRRDTETRSRYDELAASWAAAVERMDRRYRRLAVWVLVIAAGSLASSVFFYAANQARVDEINSERAANVFRSCEETNRRHDATVRQLEALVDALPSGARKDRARDGIRSTVLLIDALAPPHKDKHGRSTCPALVERQVTK